MKIPDKSKKTVVEICRVFLGAVFVFSGFVKAVDPLGTTYKNLDYFSAFGLNVFDFAALPLAFAQLAVEFAMGVCLLLGVYRRFHAILFLAFMCFMTPLTLYLAVKNPVTDCGCFGDALVITNWQTFFKNIFLLAASLVVFFEYKRITPLYRKKLPVTLWAYTFILGVSFYCYVYLPVLDFRPYKIGANISEQMKIPEGAPADSVETMLVYSKGGVKQEFTLKTYPKGDTAWTFVDTKIKLIKKGYEPPVHNFFITNEEGDDITEEVLTERSYTFLLIAHKLEKASDNQIERINEIYDYCLLNGYKFYCLTASLPPDIKEWKENTSAEYPFCTVDDITLKTIVRSNPGLLLLKEGNIINKWPNRRIPGEKMLTGKLEDGNRGQIPPNHDKRNIIILSIVFISLLLVLFCREAFTEKRKKRKINS